MIKVKGITKTFENCSKEEAILKNINLDVKKGELITIMGPTGSGKSTFLYILSTMVSPSSGEVYLNGKNIDYSDDEKLNYYRKREIGFIFQGQTLISALNPLENLIIAMNTDESSRQKKIRAKRLLSEIGLKGKESSEICSLSTGEIQRITVARALVNNPKIIFCDELTSSLDSKSSKNVMDILLGYKEKNDATIIIVTHDIDVAKKGDRKFYLEDGEINELC